MLRKTMIVLATAAALTAGLTADAFARGGGGGGGHMGGGFGGGHMGGIGGVHMGGGIHPHFAGARGRFGYGAGDLGLYDNSCGYTSLYYNPNLYNCDLYGSPLGTLYP
jgi:hypothetical protein